MYERLCLGVLGHLISEPTAALMFLTRLPEIPLCQFGSWLLKVVFATAPASSAVIRGRESAIAKKIRHHGVFPRRLATQRQNNLLLREDQNKQSSISNRVMAYNDGICDAGSSRNHGEIGRWGYATSASSGRISLPDRSQGNYGVNVQSFPSLVLNVFSW